MFSLDEFESTSYESYEDEEEEGTAVYENQDFQQNKQRYNRTFIYADCIFNTQISFLKELSLEITYLGQFVKYPNNVKNFEIDPY